MDDTLVQQVWERARGACEYCRLPQTYSHLPFEIDHIIPRKHKGPTTIAVLNLNDPVALATREALITGRLYPLD